MATWEWLGTGDLQKELIIRKTASREAGEYGPTYVYDQTRPEERNSFEGTGLTLTEVNSLLTVGRTKDGTYSLTDNAGTAWSGRLVGVSFKRVKGASVFDGVVVTLRSQADEPEE